MTTLNVGKALNLATKLLVRAGLPDGEAETSARCIVTSDCWGIPSHGLMRLPFYLERILAGGINPNANMKKVTDLPSLVIYDGENGLGHWQLQQAAYRATALAQRNGVAAVGVGRSSHCGALGIYVWPMVTQNLVGIAFSTGPAVMPPWNGSSAMLSTSPIAAGIPTAPPTIIDLATSAVARGKIAAKAQAGEALEPGWAFAADGLPTLVAKEALTGLLAPLGGAKGYALAVLVESLTGVLVGPSLAKDIPDMFDSKQAANPQEISHFVIAIDAARLSVDGKHDRIAIFQTEVTQAGGRLPGSGRVDPADLVETNEIVISDTIWTQLHVWAKRLGVSF
ncbi:MAG: Ldh family oxidoreductase [Actinobacteria bacterium]|nr:Ldh family oxidoreductase [Actinomycetota bacterium]